MPSISQAKGVFSGSALIEMVVLGIPVVEFLRVRFVQKMIKRFVEYVGTPAASESQRKQQILKEGFVSCDERRDEFVLDVYFVSPIGHNLVTNKFGTRGGEINGPRASSNALHVERQFCVDKLTTCRGLRCHEGIEKFR